ncbi:sigma-70 family RNA polymerase sigma factor [Agriterribacter sp.]|uniref:RNA polymerase sigma factor n=1 Tax=Agriterribacter sp. TaxID=2821509 RepID=UPI002CB8129F|nr:sigma-70 family RNA polymerase sigma factor [Agriterribacter sp.]HRP57168.1 sigma-70 family RNA polymerase sigma factor [Agriterribacter sp.]
MKYDDFDLFRQLGMHPASANAALAAIYRAFKTVLVLYIKNYIRNDEDLIKDVIAETMLVLWIQRKEAAQKEKPLPWLLTIAHHIAIDKIRAQKKYYTEPLENHLCLPGNDHAARETERKELEALFRKAAERLPPQERNILLLSKIEELPHRQIALQFSVSVQTVKNQLSRALKKIRRYMEEALSSFII